MMLPIENNDTFLLFFHGLDSSNETSKYTCMTREPKYCQTVNYREDFEAVFEIYDALIQEKMKQYPRVVLAGHSLGGWFANHFAHKYNLRALLIAPCIYPSEVLADRIPQVADRVPVAGTREVAGPGADDRCGTRCRPCRSLDRDHPPRQRRCLPPSLPFL